MCSLLSRVAQEKIVPGRERCGIFVQNVAVGLQTCGSWRYLGRRGTLEGFGLSAVLSETKLMPLKPRGGALCQQHVPHCHADHFCRESCDATDNAMVHTPARGVLLLFLLLFLRSLAETRTFLILSGAGDARAVPAPRLRGPAGACTPRARRAWEKQHHLEHS